MISVDPIRDEQKIQTMKSYLKGKNLRDHALFVVGINIALRITYLLALTWADVVDENGKFKEIRILEGKTKKERRIQLNKPSQRALEELLGSLDDHSMDDYLFQSREGGQKPLSRQQALNILRKPRVSSPEDFLYCANLLIFMFYCHKRYPYDFQNILVSFHRSILHN